MVLDLGLIDYEEAYRKQKEFVRLRRLGEMDDSIILAEHHPVFTIGRTGGIENLLENEKALAERGIKVLRVDRGGDITFHGPGQLVVYPIIDLKRYGRDLHKYLRNLEDMAMELLGRYSVRGERVTGKTGVWVRGKKIASIGVAASNWITFHGMSININVELGFFSMINPCGMRGIEMTSLAAILDKAIDIREIKDRFINIIDADAVLA
jgi:lipoate-protein ligase B